MSTQRPLSEDEVSQLAVLNASVQSAIDTRREWLDAKTHETSKLQVGDDIYDVEAGAKLGTVSGLYRYHAGINDIYDTYVHCHHTYRTTSGLHDNTSRHIDGRSFGTHEDAVREARLRAARLEMDQ